MFIVLSLMALMMAVVFPMEFTNTFSAIVLQFLVLVACWCLDSLFRKRYAHDKKKSLFIIWGATDLILISLISVLLPMQTVEIMTRRVFIIISGFCTFAGLLEVPQTTHEDEIAEEERDGHEKN